MRWTLALALGFGMSAACAQGIEVREAWSRATPPGAKVAAGYARIGNPGARPDRLVSATTDVAKRVEMHVTAEADGVSRMRQVQTFEIPARGVLELRPGGGHLMLVDITRPLAKGERFRMRLRFERAGEVEAQFEVRELGARQPHRH
ncbi:MAG: hypothetical protein K0R40_89 [Burkholderiales bacterium]|nr:hypothetical protein [Burkholderiales bacterium]